MSLFLLAALHTNGESRSIDLDAQKVDRLATLCKVWGYLKYYHPGAESKDWDSVLVQSIPAVRAASSTESFERILFSLWKEAGGTIHGNPARVSSDTLVSYINWDWIEKIQDGELRSKLLFLKGIDRDSTGNTFVTNRLANGNKIGWSRFAEDPYVEMLLPSEEYRLLGLFRFWNIIQYFFPYLHLMDQKWDVTLTEFIPRFIEAKDTLAYHLVVKSLATHLNDGHGFAYSQLIGKHFGTLLTPFDIDFIEGKYVVAQSKNDSLCAVSDIRIGDEIIEIHGQPIEKHIVFLRKYIGGSNESAIRGREIPDMLEAWRDSSSSATIRRGSQTLTRTLQFYTWKTITSTRTTAQRNAPPMWEEIKPGIGYIDMGRLVNPDTLSYLFSDFKNTKSIILDFRSYPRFQVMYKFLRYVYSENRPFAVFTSPMMEMPGYFRQYDDDGFLFEDPVEERYRGKLILVVNEHSGSLGEFFPMALQLLTSTVTVGSQTWGADGNQVGFAMPGGISAGFTGMGVYYPDGTVCQRNGLEIDIEVLPTVRGLLERRDEVLEAAILKAQE